MPSRRRRRRREDEGAKREITPAIPPSSPHFFKIILSHTLESGKLGIPKGFLRRYAEDLSGSVLLKVPGGSTWPVKLEKSSNDTVWLWKGWGKFMEHYLIGHGHLIVFKYEGDSIFHVMIFDKSASEIDYPLSIRSDVSSPEGELISRKEGSVTEIEDSEGFVPCSLPCSNGSSREFGVPRPLTALELASEFKLDHPVFKVVMRPTYVQKGLHVPHEFFRKHVQKNKEIATLRCSDRSWQVKLWRYEHRNMASLTTGWSSFVRETSLCVGDVCLFELIDRDNSVFRVSIFSSEVRWRRVHKSAPVFRLFFLGYEPPQFMNFSVCAGPIKSEGSQCQEGSSEPAFHSSPCPSPVSAYEKASQFKSEYPFFYVVLLPIHMKRKSVIIPWKFIKTYMREGQRMVTLVYSGRSWEVKLRGYQHSHIASLGTGWSAFARAACLREGDACVFELIKRDDIVFGVSIFSSADKEVICID